MDDVSQIASRSPALRRLLRTLEQEGGMQGSDVDRSYEMVAQDQEQSDSVAESEAGSLGLLPVRPAQLRFSRARLDLRACASRSQPPSSVAPSPAPVWRAAAAVASSGVGCCCEGGPFFREGATR